MSSLNNSHSKFINVPENRNNSEIPAKATIECLGKKFDSDDERREYFLNILDNKLKNPGFRKIEGFPVGRDEDILSLSDPPYYTACPNPFIEDFIKLYGRKYDIKENYHREPFTADIEEGKNDPLYYAHTYHTKVPHKAIMRFILYYTKPNDIVLDGFSGTGMTGVAALKCLNPEPEIKSVLETEWSNNKFSQIEWGKRFVILNDLSPIASFIAYNYNIPSSFTKIKNEMGSIIDKLIKKYSWVYRTSHKDGRQGKINYIIWSEKFICPECSNELTYWDIAVDENRKFRDKFVCPFCNKNDLTKGNLEKAYETIYDPDVNKVINQIKRVPVLINYTVEGLGRFEKKPDIEDFSLINLINDFKIENWYPINPVPDGDKTRETINIGVTNVHHFYTKRNLMVISALVSEIANSKNHHELLFILTSMIVKTGSKLHNVGLKDGKINLAGQVPNTLYIPSIFAERNIFELVQGKISDIECVFTFKKDKNSTIIETTATQNLNLIPSDYIDYIFTDPPFGSNLMYSELNFIYESWLKVYTNNVPEAIENFTQNKKLFDYQLLMERCFKEYYRVLKPSHWMTVEFSNTEAKVWNAIQNALEQAGFVVANVSALDKKQKTYNAMTTPTAVKQDLIISCYKPNDGLEQRFNGEASTEEGVWDFIRTHLKYLPVYKGSKEIVEIIPERDPRILFDRMVAYYVRHGFQIPISSPEFQKSLTQRFTERDGMFFLPEQAIEYDKKRMQAREMGQRRLFVCDERSAVEWIRDFLKGRPSKMQDIQPEFMPLLGAGWTKHEKKMELAQLLEENFLRFDGMGEVPSQIHSYLSTNFKELRNLSKDDPFLVEKARDRWYVPDPNKAGDLEKLRERVLLREFEQIKQSKSKEKVIRIEAVRAGFKEAWSHKDYDTIVGIARKLPEDVIQSDDKLLMYYENALSRIGE